MPPKRKTLHGGSSSSSPGPKAKRFPSQAEQQSFDEVFVHRHVVVGKILNPSFTNSPGLRLGTLFERLGWQFFTSINQPCYPTLVREFYCNMEFGHRPDTFSTFVRGVTISLNPDSISQIFHIRRGDIRTYSVNAWNQGHGFDPLSACRLITGNAELVSPVKPKASALTFEARLLHHILTYTVLPRAGGRDSVSFFDIFLIWCILENKSFDLSYLICRHISETQRKSKTSSLPYGFALTSIFHHFHVPLEDEPDRYEPIPTDYYSPTILSLMGYKLEGTSYVPKVSRVDPSVPASSSHPSSSSAPSFSPPRHSAPPAPDIMEQLSILSAQVLSLSSTISSLSASHSQAFETMQASLLSSHQQAIESLRGDIFELGTSLDLLRTSTTATQEMLDRRLSTLQSTLEDTREDLRQIRAR